MYIFSKYYFIVYYYKRFMDQEQNDFDVKPANHTCSSASSTSITAAHGSQNAAVSQNLDTVNSQNAASSQYDNVDNMNVKPMYGGTLKKYKIIFRKKTYFINELNESSAIKKILNNKIYKKDYFLEIYYNIYNSLYIIRANHKNKFVKI